MIRVDGVLHRVEQEPPLDGHDTEEVALGIMPPDRRDDFHNRNEADFAYGVAGVGRFRVNVFRQRGSVSLVLRMVRVGSPTFDDLGLPGVVQTLADEPRGLVLVTGPTGTGKTTTIGSMVDHINQTRACHIVTIEDPIEVVHPDRTASINQREVGVDTDSFIGAMRAVMRQDPDVIFIGEMRDAETVQAALAAAETGHLVLSTLHTINAAETVNRIIEFYPPHQHKQARITLAGSLRGIISQRLLMRTDGRGRIPSVEILVSNGRVYDAIVNPDQTHLLHDIIAEGEFYGMQTFD